jgi:hypothetical protein
MKIMNKELTQGIATSIFFTLCFLILLTYAFGAAIPSLSFKSNNTTYPTGVSYVLALVGGTTIWFSIQRSYKLKNALSNIEGFSIAKQYPPSGSLWRTSGIALDENHNQVCFYYYKQGKLITYIFSGSDILESEVIEDGYSLNKISTSSVAGRAALGGLLLGPVGAIVGGATAKRKIDSKVRSIDLRIVVNDLQKPVHAVNFLNIEVDRSSNIYKSSLALAQNWHAIVDILIKRSTSSTEAQREGPKTGL